MTSQDSAVSRADTADKGGYKVGAKPGYLRTIANAHRARKLIRCDSCGHIIEPGDEYVRHALPPFTEPYDTPGWKVMRCCGWWTSDCRRYWEIDSRELSGEPHVLPV